MSRCAKCSSGLAEDHVEAIADELDELSNKKQESAPRIRARLRQLVHMLRGLCASCAHHACQREFHKCKRCNTEAYGPATACPECGGELWGVARKKGAA